MTDRPAEVDHFLSICQSPPNAEHAAEQLVVAYKRALASAYAAFHKYISPSAFVLSPAGSLLTEDCKDDFAAGRWEAIAERRESGLPGAEFTPLDPTHFKADQEPAKTFQLHYNRYKTEVVVPLFGRLQTCDSLAVLVDMAHILVGGPDMYDDADRFLKYVLDALDPGTSLLALPAKLLPRRYRPGRRIQRIAFVAPQIDRFHDDDHQQVRTLLSQLVQPHFDAYTAVETEKFVVSAVCSAVAKDDGHVLMGMTKQQVSESNGPIPAWHVARLPAWERWPDEWDPEEFKAQGGFPRSDPVMPRLKKAAPEHLGLDKLFQFLMGWQE